jgi:steroid delta-isomerase
METQKKIAAVDRYIEAFEKADMAIIKELYADNAVVEDPVGTDAHRGIDAICTFYEGALASGAKLVPTGTPRCAGNAVAFPFQVTMPGMTIAVIDVFEFDEQEKVSSMKAYWGAENLIS